MQLTWADLKFPPINLWSCPNQGTLKEKTMKIIKLEEAGYESAIKGLALSFYDHAIPFEEFWTQERRDKSAHRLEILAFKGGGHNKALASVFCWFFIQAPRCWWSEYDTYKVATTANSSSTMHTLDKREVTMEDFEVGTSAFAMDAMNSALGDYKNPESLYFKNISALKMNLPEGWLQERQVCVNYMTLQNILRQREGHRLKMWQTFREQVLAQVEHPELIWKHTGETL
jgi:hypothetical protein